MAGEVKSPTTGRIDSETLAKLGEDMMEGKMELDLTIDEEFRDLIYPLDPGAREELKLSLQNDGCRDKLVTCNLEGKSVLLDGHHRYEICRELNILFETREVKVSDRNEAKVWIIKNQRGRRNLNESQRALLAVVLKEIYSEQAKERQGTRTDLDRSINKDEAGSSAKKAGKDMGVSHQSVSSAVKLTRNGIPELKELVESGNVAVSAAVKAVGLTEELQLEVVKRAEEVINSGKHANIMAIIHEVAPKSLQKDAEARLGKSHKKIEDCLKLLEDVEITQSPKKLVQVQELVEKLLARLKEIGAKTPNPSPEDADEENKLDDDDPDFIEDSSFNPIDASFDPTDDESNPKDESALPEDWEVYQAAIDDEEQPEGQS